jgi:hypothetical protein
MFVEVYGHVIDFETPMAKFHLKGRAGKKIAASLCR